MAVHINEENIFSEYKIKIDLLEGILVVTQECRESYYYLKSLEIWLAEIIIIEKNDVKQLEKIRKNVNNAKIEFEKLDKEVLQGKGDNSNSNSNNNEKFTGIVANKNNENTQSDFSYLESMDIPNYIIKFVKLKSKIDKIQTDAVVFLSEIRDKINEAIVNENEKLKLIDAQYGQKILSYRAFNHSHQEDKIITYEIFCTNTKINSEFSKHKIKLPIIFKATEYTYILDKNRKILNEKYELTMKLLELRIKVDEEEQLKKLNKKQYLFNQQVVILTYVITILTVITLIIGGISLKYIIDDHSNKVNICDTDLGSKRDTNNINNKDNTVKKTEKLDMSSK